MRARLKNEVVRKAFHVSGITVPLVYFYLGRDYAILYTSAALLGFMALEFIRTRAHSLFPLRRTADMIERQKEKTAIAAYIYFSIAAVLCLYFFDKFPVIVGVSAALLGDAAAAIFGVWLGWHKLKSGKSLEGSTAGVLVVIAIAYALNCNPATIVVSGLVFLMIDLVELGIDDNFTAPLAMVVVIQLFEAIL